MERIKAIPESLPATSRPVVLSIAGMDPTSGAGLLSDIKTFEQSGVYGLGINTGNTIQTDLGFFDMQWTPMSFMANSVRQLAARFDVAAIKIGILPTVDNLFQLVEILKVCWPDAAIVWDPVIRSTTAFQFMDPESWTNRDRMQLLELLPELTLLTPNLFESEILARAVHQVTHATGVESPKQTAESAGELSGKLISNYCPVLLTGGHRAHARGTDILYMKGFSQRLEITPGLNAVVVEKHGSGCVLSAAITAALASGQALASACIEGKAYVTAFLSSNQTLYGLHVQ